MEKINNRDLLYKKSATPLIVDDDFEADPLLAVHKFVNKYNKKISEGFVNKKIINEFYSVLCYEYNLTIDGVASVSPVNFNKSFLTDILKWINENYEKEDKELIRISYEIIVLQLKLYCSIPDINELFESFMEYQSSIKDNGTDIYYKILECFVDALSLKLLPNEQKMSVMGIGSSVIEEIRFWFKRIEQSNWKLFISLIIKMINLFDQRFVLERLWTMILKFSKDEWQKSLILLSILVDDILSLASNQIVDLNYEFCRNKILWELILRGLRSSVEQDRKQGLCSMKKILDFLEENRKIMNSELNIIPFIFCSKDINDPATKDVKSKFFLVMESLEEKQAQSIIPTLTYMETLIQFHANHSLCSSCLDIKWIQYIFDRVLNHEVEDVVKSGLIILLQIDPKIYNEDLLVLLINALNATTIYDKDILETEPLIVKELSELFVKAEYSQITFINQFICQASQITWAPIPLFYVMSSVFKAGHMFNERAKCNIWTKNELDAVSIIVDKFFDVKFSDLEYNFREIIIDVIDGYANGTVVLDVLAKIYSKFKIDDFKCSKYSTTLEQVSNYLRRKVTIDQAVQYTLDNCSKFSQNLTENNEKNNAQQFSRMIIHLCSSGLIFQSKLCTELTALCTVFDPIILAEANLDFDMNNYLKQFDLLNCFLTELYHFREHYECKFIYDALTPCLESVLVIISKNLNQLSFNLSYKDIKIYTDCYQAVLTAIKHIDGTSRRRIDYLTEVLNEIKLIIDQYDCNEVKNIKLLFVLHIQYSCVKHYEDSKNPCVTSLINLCIGLLNSSICGIQDEISIAECYELIAQTMSYLTQYPRIKVFTEYETTLISVLIIFKRLVNATKKFVLPSVIELISSLDQNCDIKEGEYLDTVEPIVDIVWKNLWDMERDNLFFKSFDVFIELLFYKYTKSNCFSNDKREEYKKKIKDESKNIPLLRHIINKNLLRRWNSRTIPDLQTLIIDTFLFDNHFDCMDNKIERQFQLFVFNIYYRNYENKRLTMSWLGKDLFKKNIFNFTQSIMLCLIFLDRLYFNGWQNWFCPFFLPLLENFRDESGHKSSYPDFTKRRIVQLLLMSTIYIDAEQATEFFDIIGDIILTQNEEPYVRVMQEWFLIRICIKYPTIMCDKLWILLEKAKEKKPSGIASMASIIYHVSQHFYLKWQKSPDDPANYELLFIQSAIVELIPCIISPHFTVRLYSQVIFTSNNLFY